MIPITGSVLMELLSGQECRAKTTSLRSFSTPLIPYSAQQCCVEAECHFCYLRGSSVYVHESCCLGVQRHLPTYMKRRKCQDGPETYMQQIWYVISVTSNVNRV